MVAPVVTVWAPPPSNYPDPGIVRPEALVEWSGATGPTVDVLHEWDTDSGFGSPISDLNAGISGGSGTNPGVPPADLGPPATQWHYRVTVTDNDDSASTTSPTKTLDFFDPINERRYLYELANAGVGFDPIDTPAGGWGPDPDPEGGGDGYAIDFRRYLYELGNADTTTPTPHIWYLFPTYGREGWQFKVVGFGFGATQGTYSGVARLNALTVGIISWDAIAEVGAGLEIDPAIDLANPEHEEIIATVPVTAVSGLVYVDTDGP